jgi:cytochrome c-type biogenesis protein CcmH/NrfG
MKQIAKPSSELANGPAVPPGESAIAFSNVVPLTAKAQLVRMFRDPSMLEKVERTILIEELRKAVELRPSVPELRVLLGMTLCVDLNVQPALEELREAVRVGPDSFLAHLKLGELLMRLRICTEAAEETHMAARLARNAVQSELARRQAAIINAMLRAGIERGGYNGLLARLSSLVKKAAHKMHKSSRVEVTATIGPG